MLANNEDLPFPDTCIDTYIANLSIHVVNDHKKMIAEAYRVLEDGGVAGFTTFGKAENTYYFDRWPKLLKEHGIDISTGRHSNFDRGDKDQMEKDIKEAGFRHAKLFYAQNNKPYFSAETTFGYMASRPDSKPHLDKLTEEKFDEIKQAYVEEFNKYFGPDSPDPMSFEVLVAVAWK